MEDCGTLGLIGQNIPAEEVSEKMARGEQLSSDERLARFSSMFNSGNNTTGSGLFGAGKSVYSVASMKKIWTITGVNLQPPCPRKRRLTGMLLSVVSCFHRC